MLTPKEARFRYDQVVQWIEDNELYPSDEYPYLTEEDGEHCHIRGTDSTATANCTCTAVIFTIAMDGMVCGYPEQDNYPGLIGMTPYEGGHDFAVIEDRYIMDWWAASWFSPAPGYGMLDGFYDMETQWDLVLELYGHPVNWDCREFGADDWMVSDYVRAGYDRQFFEEMFGV
jgi:hypothetical protein